jgi:hypothetical protein
MPFIWMHHLSDNISGGKIYENASYLDISFIWRIPGNQSIWIN